MNLHQVVSGAIGGINPFITATLRQSTGYTTNPDGSRASTYTDTIMQVQVQALTTEDLMQLDGLNIQGSRHSVYMNGNWNGAIRVSKQGGDLLKFNGQTWLAVAVLEAWPDWTRLAVVLQDGS
jgi:hypothetical protein